MFIHAFEDNENENKFEVYYLTNAVWEKLERGEFLQKKWDPDWSHYKKYSSYVNLIKYGKSPPNLSDRLKKAPLVSLKQ